jgi:hypothetical protein
MKKRVERKGRAEEKKKGAGSEEAGKDTVVWHRRPKVPPPECDIWPEEFRGERWKPIYAFLFAGKCVLCTHSTPLPRSRRLLDKRLRVSHRLHCTNHPCNPGGLEEVLLTDTCRNFKPKWWRRSRAKRAKGPSRAAAPRPLRRGSKRIPLGNGLFATVDAADYPELSKHRWYANRHGRTIYAMCHSGGRDIYMHRMIMRPRRGSVVHHIDHNGLNNRRENLRICTRRQHLAGRGPVGGASRFVGVYRRGDRWEARIACRGKVYYLGLFDDEVEAAKARDRKAYELYGEFAYLNFPEDFAHKGTRKSVEAFRRAGGPLDR